MPDLHALLAAEARRQEPEKGPDFDDLLVRARRRQARRGLTAVSAVVAVVVAVALGGWWLTQRSTDTSSASAPRTPSTPPAAVSLPVPVAVYDKLRALALELARQNGDPSPTRMEAVQVDLAVPAASRRPNASTAPLTSGYVVEIEGAFTCSYCKGHGDFRASVMQEQVASDFGSGSRDFGGPWQDLTKYGKPFNLGTAQSPATATHIALPVSAPLYARLRQIAVQLASTNGDPHPTKMEAVAVADVNRADEVMSGAIIGGSGGPGYVVEVQGTFVCGACSVPFGGKAPHGTVADVVVRSGSYAAESDGLGGRWTDLNRLGAAFSLATATTASPIAVVTTPQPSPPSVPPATESAGPTSPDPHSLDEAKQRAKASAIDVAKASISLAAQTSADELRVAGLDIPAAVPANTPMYVVVVNGEPIFPSSVDSNGARATSFAVVFNTDGTSLGDQVLYRGAFNLPPLTQPVVPQPTIVAAGDLAPAPGLDVLPADGQKPPMALKSILARQPDTSLAKPRGALVYANTLHVTHRLAWLAEYDCVALASAGPGGGVYLETSQVLYDATTGAQLTSTTY